MGAGDYFFGISSATSGLCAPRRAQTRCLMAIHPLTHALRPLARLFGLRIDAAAVGQQRGAVLFAASADARLLPALAQKCAPSRRQPAPLRMALRVPRCSVNNTSLRCEFTLNHLVFSLAMFISIIN